MSRFAEFNKAINMTQVAKDMAEAKENEYKEVPKGRYAVKFEKMEIGVTGEKAKTPNVPMFKLQARIVGKVDKEGDVVKCGYEKSCLFMNKVIYVANETEKWNTGKAIQVVVSFLEGINSETPIEFKDYDQFSDLVLDLAEECEGLEFEVEYDPDGFNSISIKDVWEV
jgi:hypothetical protein